MSISENVLADHSAPGDGSPDRMTVEEFARQIGMSARNIRALQGRGLLPRPVRIGRQAFYLERHVRRAEAIKDLQRQGYNLFAIGSLLGAGETDPQAADIATVLERVNAHGPELIATLRHHGIVARAADGDIQVSRPKPVKTALALRQLGVPVPATLRILADVLDAMEPAASELLRFVQARIVDEWDRSRGPGMNSNPVARTQAVITLLSETMRVVLENIGSELVLGAFEVRGMALSDD